MSRIPCHIASGAKSGPLVRDGFYNEIQVKERQETNPITQDCVLTLVA